MSNTYRVPAMTLPPAVMRDIRAEAKRTGQTVTAVVRARVVKDYENAKATAAATAPTTAATESAN